MTTASGDIAGRQQKGRFPLTRKKWPRLIPLVKEAVKEVYLEKCKGRGKKKKR